MMDNSALVVRVCEGRVDVFGPFKDDGVAWDWAEESFPASTHRGDIHVRRVNTACEILGVKAPTVKTVIPMDALRAQITHDGDYVAEGHVMTDEDLFALMRANPPKQARGGVVTVYGPYSKKMPTGYKVVATSVHGTNGPTWAMTS